MPRDTLSDDADIPSATSVPAGGPPLLTVTIQNHSRGGRPILGPIGFSVAEAETVALTGPSGIGKSTLLRCIAGLDRPTDGHIDAPERLGMVFQEPLLLPWRSARDNLTLTTGVGHAAAEDLLAEVGLTACAGLFTGQMSLGQQRRLALARAFACAPRLLLLDEPFVSLDPPLAREMMTLLARLRARYRPATLLVTHSQEEACLLSDRILTLGGAPARIVSDKVNVPSL